MLLGAIGYNISTIFLTEYFSIWYFHSAILSVGVSTVIDFILSKIWVFKPYNLTIGIPKEVSELENEVSITLIISALDEENNIVTFVDELMDNLHKNIDLNLYLVNNGSSDSTGSKIDEMSKKYGNIKPIHRETPLDYSNSIKDVLNSQTINTEYVGWAWSDNQISGKSVNSVMEIAGQYKPKFTKAFRYEKDYSILRKIQSFFFNALTSILFQGRIQDVNGCPKLIQTELISQLNLEGNGWFIDAEALLKTIKIVDDSEIVYVPVLFNKRQSGKSKTSWSTAFELFFQLLQFRFFKFSKWKKDINLNLEK